MQVQILTMSFSALPDLITPNVAYRIFDNIQVILVSNNSLFLDLYHITLIGNLSAIYTSCLILLEFPLYPCNFPLQHTYSNQEKLKMFY